MKITKFDYRRILISSIVLLCTTIFISGISYYVNYAEAAPADAITDLALQSITSYKSDRNNITLSWSAPNDNGGTISTYVLQVHLDHPRYGWHTIDNKIQGTTYTIQNTGVNFQFSYRIWAISSDGCVGPGNMRNDVIPGCNESNILHVVSLPNGEYGEPLVPQCENKKLDDCGYFPAYMPATDETPAPIKLETPAPIKLETPAPIKLETPAPIEQPPSTGPIEQPPSTGPIEQPPPPDPFFWIIFGALAIVIMLMTNHVLKAKRNRPARSRYVVKLPRAYSKRYVPYLNRTKERQEIPGDVRHEVYLRDDYRCCNCGKGQEDYDLQIDHIRPVSQGGTDDIDNLQTLCKECNKEKGNKWKGSGHSYHE